jgi:hypothetical protein
MNRDNDHQATRHDDSIQHCQKETLASSKSATRSPTFQLQNPNPLDHRSGYDQDEKVINTHMSAAAFFQQGVASKFFPSSHVIPISNSANFIRAAAQHAPVSRPMFEELIGTSHFFATSDDVASSRKTHDDHAGSFENQEPKSDASGKPHAHHHHPIMKTSLYNSGDSDSENSVKSCSGATPSSNGVVEYKSALKGSSPLNPKTTLMTGGSNKARRASFFGNFKVYTVEGPKLKSRHNTGGEPVGSKVHQSFNDTRNSSFSTSVASFGGSRYPNAREISETLSYKMRELIFIFIVMVANALLLYFGNTMQKGFKVSISPTVVQYTG